MLKRNLIVNPCLLFSYMFCPSVSDRSIDRTRLKPIVHIAPIPTNESQQVHLVAITQSGTVGK